jgi:uncharacterized protein (TIGR02145 family)
MGSTSYAYYWSTTEVNTNYAYCLIFNVIDDLNPYSQDNKRYGMQVRCVK